MKLALNKKSKLVNFNDDVILSWVYYFPYSFNRVYLLFTFGKFKKIDTLIALPVN